MTDRINFAGRFLRTAFAGAALLWTALPSEAIKITWGPYLQNVTENEAVIMWGTDKPAVSWVEIAPGDAPSFYSEERPQFFQTYLGRKVKGVTNAVKVTGLAPATTYGYRIFSKEILDDKGNQVSYGDVAATDVYRKKPLKLTTVDPSQPGIRFCVINDIHADNGKQRNLLRDVWNDKNDFVVFNGDMVSSMESEQQILDGFINTAVELFASEKPFYMIRGNHEGRGVFADRYMDYFPSNTGMPYFTFRRGPVFFLVLDGGEDKPDSDIEYGGMSHMDKYREEQAEWMKTVVESKEFREAPFRVVLLHEPPCHDVWHGAIHEREVFLPVLNSAGIDLMVCGHLHEYFYDEPNTPDPDLKGYEVANFPILVNSNKDIVKMTADRKNLEFTVYSPEGKVIKHKSLASKK